MHKNFQVRWEELASWVSSFSYYHVVCCGLLRGLAPCKSTYICVMLLHGKESLRTILDVNGLF